MPASAGMTEGWHLLEYVFFFSLMLPVVPIFFFVPFVPLWLEEILRSAQNDRRENPALALPIDSGGMLANAKGMQYLVEYDFADDFAGQLVQEV